VRSNASAVAKPARPGTTERRLALVIVLAAIVPLVFAIWIGKSLAARAASMWLNPELSQRLAVGLEAQDALIASTKREFRHHASDLARDPSLAVPAKQRDTVRLEAIGAQAAAECSSLTRWAIRNSDGDRIAEYTRTALPSGATGRVLTVRVPVAGSDNAELDVDFAAPEQLLQSRESSANFYVQYTQMVAAKHELYAGHLAAFGTLLGLTVLVTAVVAVLLARGVTKRVRRLAAALRQLGKGDLSARVPETGNDELTELACNFNDMASEIAHSRGRIEYLRRVAEWQEMAKRLAHEIKNPLTPILLLVEEAAAQYHGSDLAYAQLLATTQDVVREEINTLRRLVTEFSSFARLPEAQPKPVAVDEFIAETKLSFAATHDSSIRWQGELPGAYCQIDKQMMRRAIANLVENALQAAAEVLQSQRVLVRVEQAERTVLLSVEDAGPGIPLELGERVFEPYVTQRRGGTGLGLAIAKKIVVEHGGTLNVGTSAELAGARLTICLPLLPGDVSA
jgi:two-component system, NtrC family, nitrogen regulation sensor histidine kinase NtrY